MPTKDVPILTPEQQTRFWSFVDRSGGPTACWPWRGGLAGGYGHFSIKHQAFKAHRITYTLHYGPPAPGLWILHRCEGRYPPGDPGSRACCNPAHLYAGSHRDNVADVARSGHQARGQRTRPETRVRGEWQHSARLQPDQVLAARASYVAGGVSMGQLAQHYGVSKQAMASVLRGESWAHLPGACATSWHLYPERVPRGVDNGRAKLTAAQVDEIRQRHAAGASMRGLARAYGVHWRTVGRIVRGQCWAHLLPARGD